MKPGLLAESHRLQFEGGDFQAVAIGVADANGIVSLRLMDSTYLKAAMEVIFSDASRCQREVHEWLNQLTGRVDFGRRFEILAHEYRRKGRCKKEYLDPVSPENLLIEQPEPICKQIVHNNPAPVLS